MLNAANNVYEDSGKGNIINYKFPCSLSQASGAKSSIDEPLKHCHFDLNSLQGSVYS